MTSRQVTIFFTHKTILRIGCLLLMKISILWNARHVRIFSASIIQEHKLLTGLLFSIHIGAVIPCLPTRRLPIHFRWTSFRNRKNTLNIKERPVSPSHFFMLRWQPFATLLWRQESTIDRHILTCQLDWRRFKMASGREVIKGLNGSVVGHSLNMWTETGLRWSGQCHHAGCQAWGWEQQRDAQPPGIGTAQH